MILELKLTNDAGEVVAYAKSDHPEQPLQWRSLPNQPVLYDKNKTDVIFIHSYTVQPLCTLQLNYKKGINVESQPIQFEQRPVISAPSVPIGNSAFPIGNAGSNSNPLGSKDPFRK